MGIRIKKLMGYSLSLKEVNGLDCHVNMAWRDHEEFLENEEKWDQMCEEIISTQDSYENGDPFLMESMYLKMIKDNKKKIKQSDRTLWELKHGAFYKYITYNDEFGNEDTLLLRPLMAPVSWVRYDDPIDYIESALSPHYGEPTMVRHNHALYPFVRLMRKNPDSYMGIEEYWSSCYLDDPNSKDAIPTCTYSVMLMLKYMNIVPEDKLTDVIMLLRPAIYTYWS